MCHVLILHISGIIWYVFFSDLFLLVWWCLVVSMVLLMALFPSFYGWVVFRCMYEPHLLYPLFCWRTFRLFPCSGYCEQCYYEHSRACIFLNDSLYRYMLRSGIVGSYDNSNFNFLSTFLLFPIVKVKSLSHVWLSATPWTVAYQALQSMECSKQEYWSGLPFPSPGDPPNPWIEPGSPTLHADALPSEPPGKPLFPIVTTCIYSHLQCKRVPFLHKLFSICYCRFFNDDHSDWCEVVHHGSLICISLIINDIEASFHVPVVNCMSSLRNDFRSSAHFLIGLFFVVLSCMSCLYILEMKFLGWGPGNFRLGQEIPWNYFHNSKTLLCSLTLSQMWSFSKSAWHVASHQLRDSACFLLR